VPPGKTWCMPCDEGFEGTCGEPPANGERGCRLACDTGLTALGGLFRRAEKSTVGCGPWNPLNKLSKAVLLAGLGADDGEFHAEKDCMLGVSAAGDCRRGCIGGGDKSYGIGSAKDMNIGLLAIVLYGLMPFGWPNP
jgi:hypothetical protein